MLSVKITVNLLLAVYGNVRKHEWRQSIKGAMIQNLETTHNFSLSFKTLTVSITFVVTSIKEEQ